VGWQCTANRNTCILIRKLQTSQQNFSVYI